MATMTNISIPLSDEQWATLRSHAEKNGVTPEVYLLQRIDVFLGTPPDFTNAAAYVLEKNQQLYRRLGSALADRRRDPP